MPYIAGEKRIALEPELSALISKIKNSTANGDMDGTLNYVVSSIVADCFKPETGWRYHYLHRAYGVFLAAGAEFYRRLVAPYEDKCIDKSGDIASYEQ